MTDAPPPDAARSVTPLDEFAACPRCGDPRPDHMPDECQPHVAAMRAEIKQLRHEWSVMAMACGNWREFGNAITPEVAERRRLIDEADYQVAARAILERDALRAEIADAREACPSIRMQDHFDASLLELVHLEVSRGFNRDAEVERLRALVASSVVSPPNQTGKVTRLEVIDESGRRFTRWHCGIELSYQDRGRTLKIFVGPQVPDPPSLLSPDPNEDTK